MSTVRLRGVAFRANKVRQRKTLSQKQLYC